MQNALKSHPATASSAAANAQPAKLPPVENINKSCQLLSQLKEAKNSGSHEFLNEIVLKIEEKYFPGIKNYLTHKYGFDSHLLEDMCQEIVLRLYMKSDLFDDTRNERPYIFTVAGNMANDYLRRKNNIQAIRNGSLDGHSADQELKGKALLVSRENDPVDNLIANENKEEERVLNEEIKTFLIQLTGNNSCLMMAAEGMKYTEIANKLSIPLGTVKSRIHAEKNAVKRLYSVPDVRAA